MGRYPDSVPPPLLRRGCRNFGRLCLRRIAVGADKFDKSVASAREAIVCIRWLPSLLAATVGQSGRVPRGESDAQNWEGDPGLR
ncbi:hypothetical protein BURKHO8Y_480049 [Burkholderia sp. 8Y]|nr:hypothetical protein BURKHO8Y_480049 [Burkholderia sp. 8Y]